MTYVPENLSRKELLDWAAEKFPEVKIKARLSTNKFAEARHKKTGELLAKETSMHKLKEAMLTADFAKRLRIAQSGFGFNTAVFDGKGYDE